jgi:hypothetical protein
VSTAGYDGRDHLWVPQISIEPTLLLPLRAGLLVSGLAMETRRTHLLGPGLVSGREESGICCHALGCSCKLCHVLLQTSCQQGGVSRPLFAHLVMRYDLVLRLLNQHQFAELIGLMRLAIADHFGVRLKDAEQLPLGLGVAA